MGRMSLVVLVAGASLAEVQAVEPLVSTDILSATYDLMIDIRTVAWHKLGLDKVAAEAAAAAEGPLEELKKKALELKAKGLEQVGPLPPWAADASKQAEVAVLQVKALAMENYDKAYEPLNSASVSLIEKLEQVAPAYKGLIPKTLGNLILFVVYVSLVLYVLLKVSLFFIRLTLNILRSVVCGICCCGCCCRRGTSATKDGGKKVGKVAPKNGKAEASKAPVQSSNKASAAATTPAKPAAKAAGKKK